MYTATVKNIPIGENKKTSQKIAVYLLAFFAALHATPATYINSSFLGQFVGEEKVGWIFTAASLLVLFLYSFIKDLLKKYGNYNFFISAILIDMASLIILSSGAIFTDPRLGPLFVFVFMAGHVARVAMIFSLDIFLENASRDADTGGIRGIYLTSINLSFIIGPLIAGAMISEIFDVWKVYLWGAVFLFPIIFIAKKYLSDFKDREYKKKKIKEIIKTISRKKDLALISGSNFLLSFFYSWMIIYTPIFLHQIGFSLDEVATIIGIALIPFVLLQIPFGNIADKYLGEKEILTAGFIIMGLATISMTFINSSSFWIWALVLFITRIGASLVEAMNEIYLYKKVNDSDVDVISFYKSISESAYMFAPVVASLLLIFVDINFIFLILGGIILYGLRFSLFLKDTK